VTGSKKLTSLLRSGISYDRKKF